MQGPALLPALRRDRIIVGAGLAATIALAWAYTVYLSVDMAGMDSMDMGKSAMPLSHAWAATDFTAMFTMWAVMMVAMMIPSAIPMVLTFTAMNRRLHPNLEPFQPTALFVAGYIVVWSAFSIVATGAQWALHEATLLSPMMASNSTLLGGALLLGAALYQVSPLKSTCLNRCRMPLAFLMNEWREGPKGAFSVGLRHGTYCLGCCWMLMALLFVLGVMNLLWIAALGAFVLVEKIVPLGRWLSRLSAALLAGWGAALLFA